MYENLEVIKSQDKREIFNLKKRLTNIVSLSLLMSIEFQIFTGDFFEVQKTKTLERIAAFLWYST